MHEPPAGKHGHVTANLGARLWTHANLTRAGAVFVGASTFLEFALDLVVEILSPHDRPEEVLAKVGDCLDAGARLVWVIDRCMLATVL